MSPTALGNTKVEVISPSPSVPSSPEIVLLDQDKEYLPSPSPSPQRNRKRTFDIKPSPDDSEEETETKSKSKSKSKSKKRGRPAGQKNVPSGDRKMGSWTKSEVRQLWEAIGLLPVKVRWDEVADKVDGRDKLVSRLILPLMTTISRQADDMLLLVVMQQQGESAGTRWRYDLAPKFEAFIDSLGDA